MNCEIWKYSNLLRVRILASVIFGIVVSLFTLSGSAASYAQPTPSVMKLAPGDYIEIYQLYSAYSVALDTGNGAGRVATFTPDGTFSSFISKHVPETMDKVLKRTNAYPQKRIPDAGMMHVLLNIHITPTAAGANGTCYAMLYGGQRDGDGNYLGESGFYTDTLVKTSAGWRFKTLRSVFGSRGTTTYKKVTSEESSPDPWEEL